MQGQGDGRARVYGRARTAAAWLATGAAFALLGLVVVHWGWRWLGPAPTPVSEVALPERLAPVIVAAPLFGTGSAPEAAPGLPAQPEASNLRGDTRLLGVFAQRDGGGYALFRLGERGAVLVAAGGTVADGVTLSSVYPDGVRIVDRGIERDLRLRPLPSEAAPTARTAARSPSARAGGAVDARVACTGPPGFNGPVFRLNAELLGGIASQPESWTALLSAVPGGLVVRDQSGFATMLGMKSGDRMTQANGIALAGVDDVLVAFVKPLLANQAVHVAGSREGKPAEWLFVNAGACP